MRLKLISDIHLENQPGFLSESGLDRLPLPDSSRDPADYLILAGDISTPNTRDQLPAFLSLWKRPVIYIMGNHDFYPYFPERRSAPLPSGSGRSMPLGGGRAFFHRTFPAGYGKGKTLDKEVADLKAFLASNLPNVTLLHNEGMDLGEGVALFGGTAFTDFDNGNTDAMNFARSKIGDFEFMHEGRFSPEIHMEQHAIFATAYKKWKAAHPNEVCALVTHYPQLEPPPNLIDDLFDETQKKLIPANYARMLENLPPALLPDCCFSGHVHARGAAALDFLYKRGDRSTHFVALHLGQYHDVETGLH